MTKRNKIIYWIATVWLALGMISSGIVQLFKVKGEIEFITEGLGFPVYFLTILAVWKLLGVVALFLPKFPLLKEWAYAGFFFAMSGALSSHIAVGNPVKDMAGPLLLLVLIALSWYFRPAEKKFASVTQ